MISQVLIGLLGTLQVTTLVVFLIAMVRMRKKLELLKKEMERIAMDVLNKIQDSGAEILDSVAITRLGLRFPVFLGSWAIDSVLTRFLIQYLVEERPSTIVELGSGTSTVVIGRCREILGLRSGNHIVIDHDERYLSLTRRLAELNAVDGGIAFEVCPLSQQAGVSAPWYGGVRDVLAARLGGARIDLLLVDGPPGIPGTKSRYPALPMLKDFLSERCVVILDDAIRSEERETAEMWVRENPGFSVQYLHYAHRAAILRREATFRVESDRVT